MPPRKIIIDTDPGVDDTLAILLLLASPEVSIELISVTFGNTALDRAFLNILRVYAVARQHISSSDSSDAARIFPNLVKDNKTILARGADKPIEGELDLAEYFHGADGISNITQTHPQYTADLSAPDPALALTDKPAHLAILELLAAEPEGTVSIVSLGPLTTLAQAIQADPKTFARVRQVVSMGGALDVPGNTSPSAEFNVFADPYGAAIVFGAATRKEFDMVLVPLDITTRHSVAFSRLIIPPASKQNILHEFLTAILTRPRAVMAALNYGGDRFEMHDPLAAFLILDQEMFPGEQGRWTTVWRTFMLERKGEWTKGMMIVDRRGTDEEAGAVRAHDGITHDDVAAGSKAIPESSVVTEHHPHTLCVRVAQSSPGSDVFEKIFMERVYGIGSEWGQIAGSWGWRGEVGGAITT